MFLSGMDWFSPGSVSSRFVGLMRIQSTGVNLSPSTPCQNTLQSGKHNTDIVFVGDWESYWVPCN